MDYLKALHERHDHGCQVKVMCFELDVSNSIFEDEVMEEFLRQIKTKFNLE